MSDNCLNNIHKYSIINITNINILINITCLKFEMDIFDSLEIKRFSASEIFRKCLAVFSSQRSTKTEILNSDSFNRKKSRSDSSESTQ